MIRFLGLLTVLLLAGCAAQPADGPTGQGSAPTGTGAGGPAAPPDGDGLVVQVAYTGAYTTAQRTLASLPLVSVYADGRVITEGPVIAIYPGPALPNLQVATVPVERVEELARQALDAGVGEDVDWGSPDVADVPATRITVTTADGTVTAEVPGLGETLAGGEDGRLTAEQLAAREPVRALVDDLTALGGGATEPYVPAAVAALVGPEFADGSPDDVAGWPGPSLPGDPVRPGLDVSCVLAEGDAATAVLEAAAGATENTTWTGGDGGRWSIALRPLLPHERGCADL